jgi:hypothetical protein
MSLGTRLAHRGLSDDLSDPFLDRFGDLMRSVQQVLAQAHRQDGGVLSLVRFPAQLGYRFRLPVHPLCPLVKVHPP